MISTMWFKLNEWHYLILKRDIYLFVLSPVKRLVCIPKIESITLHFYFYFLHHEVFNYIWCITRGCLSDHVSFYMIWEFICGTRGRMKRWFSDNVVFVAYPLSIEWRKRNISCSKYLIWSSLFRGICHLLIRVSRYCKNLIWTELIEYIGGWWVMGIFSPPILKR